MYGQCDIGTERLHRKLHSNLGENLGYEDEADVLLFKGIYDGFESKGHQQFLHHSIKS